ncbi:acyl-CoA thioesterase [Halalkalibacter krulwichiae]|uniref:4-hydroxybenzoyl-CoA thioesterase n=1 Tax=Halalkalibacter krulwichiae TaxID=199441 RepID=A0A1X9MB81_9BACI|nr:thioesterase family protein [Halalkalibacter krulwichiae]ARK29904.1 4-hydroxybenzoyl-CoA thioesterase [Halalkalibacter krulwichiae]
MNKIDYQFKVNFGDTDAAGIVFYPNYYRWMDQATHHFFTTLGFPTSTLIRDEKVGTPIIESKCNFKFPLFFDDEVTIESTMTEMKEKVFTIEHVFLKDGNKIAGGYEVRAWCDISGERPKAIAIPNEVRDAVEKMKLIAQS